MLAVRSVGFGIGVVVGEGRCVSVGKGVVVGGMKVGAISVVVEQAIDRSRRAANPWSRFGNIRAASGWFRLSVIPEHWLCFKFFMILFYNTGQGLLPLILL
jgi:hypothetical protein